MREVEMLPAAQRSGFRVTEVECSDERLHLTVDADGCLRVETDTLAVGSRIDTFADVAFADGGPLPEQRMWISGMASGGLVVNPASVSFGLVRIHGQRVVREATVTGVVDAPFELETVSVEPDQLSVTLDRIIPTRTVVRVTLTPTLRGPLDGAVRLATPDRTRGVTLRCVGTIE